MEKKSHILDEKQSVLFIVAPYLVENDFDCSKKTVRSFLAFPYGVLTIASYIEEVCNVFVLDLNLYSSDCRTQKIEESLKQHRPSVVGISLCYDVSYPNVHKIVRTIKSFNKDTYVVMGGPAVTTAWEEILPEQPDIDALCYGEGELAMWEFITATDKRAALQKKPWISRKYPKTPEWHFVQSLNEVVHVNYKLVEIEKYNMTEAFSPALQKKSQKEKKQFFIVTSRGCPFKCVFCAEPSFNGKAMRYADVNEIIDHVRFLVEHYGMNVLTIYDDQLLIDKPRAKELFKRLAEFNLRIEMPNGVTLVFIDEELAHLMSVAGVDTVIIAIESGSEYVLKEIIKKPIRMDKIHPAIQILQKNNIFTMSFLIFGFPGERPEDRKLTIEKVKEWGLDWCLFNFATPLRGSELFKICKEKNWIDKNHLGIGSVDMTSYIIKHPELKKEQIEREVYLANLELNFVNNYRMKIGDYETAELCFREVIRRHPQHAFAHYYISKIQLIQGQDYLESYNEYKRIVNGNELWRQYSEQFNLDTLSEL